MMTVIIVYIACSNFTSWKERKFDLLVNIGNLVLVLQSFPYVLLKSATKHLCQQ